MPDSQKLFDSEHFIRTLPHRPGIYRMWGDDEDVLYVGKAKDLKKRVASYFRGNEHSTKTSMMIKKMAYMDFSVTQSEAQAFILENNLIKESRPRYNILLRDDKSYPFIHLSTQKTYPRLQFYRGTPHVEGVLFGPYADTSAVRETINILQKSFKIRSCSESFFKHRSRPCLQYQINRCDAPCVGLIDEDSYRKEVDLCMRFLQGRNLEVINDMEEQMRYCAGELKFEEASRLRDKISLLRQLIGKQTVGKQSDHYDVIACCIENGRGCMQVFHIRNGLHIGGRSYFPLMPKGDIDEAELLTAFIGQFYIRHEVPAKIVCSHPPDNQQVLVQAMQEKTRHKVSVVHGVTGHKKELLMLAKENAKSALMCHMSRNHADKKRLQALQEALAISHTVTRIECFDISHTAGSNPVASCIVFDAALGFSKKDYRVFNMDETAPGDDYAAIFHAVKRRFLHSKNGNVPLPQILFIDGGKGQVRMAMDAINSLEIEGVHIFGVAKGPARKVGAETIVAASGRTVYQWCPDFPGLHLVQKIRDEAHRFAVSRHIRRRKKAKNQRSSIHEIKGMGEKRMHSLACHFGGLQHVAAASIGDIQAIPGISENLASKIYEALHH